MAIVPQEVPVEKPIKAARRKVNAGTHTALVLTGDAGKDGKYKVQAELTAATLADAIQLIKEREL